MKKIIPILTGVCAIICLLGAAGLSVDFLSSKPAKVAKSYTSAIAKGNYKKAGKLTTDANGELYGQIEEALLGSSLADKLLDDTDVKKFKNAKILIGKPVYNETKDGASVHTTMVLPGDTDTDTLSLTKTGNKWTVD